MTLADMKREIMFQTNTDMSDLGDFLPYLYGYINEGYDILVYIWKKEHVDPANENWPPLANDGDVPNRPQWAHRGLADYATYLCYRNGNAAKQQRGLAYLQNFERIRAQLAGEGDGKRRNFFNIPK